MTVRYTENGSQAEYQSWCIISGDQVLVRNNGVVVYNGSLEKMPQDIKELTKDMVYDMSGNNVGSNLELKNELESP